MGERIREDEVEGGSVRSGGMGKGTFHSGAGGSDYDFFFSSRRRHTR